jgi:phage shock protein PspC (stress-responsive transcriptional regulator)
MDPRDHDTEPTSPRPGDQPGEQPKSPGGAPGEPPATESAPPPPPPPAGGPDRPRRLFRSRDDRWIAGVCGGLARYFNIDPVIVRVAAVALIFAGGAGVLLYLAAMLLVPAEGDPPAGQPGGTGRAATIAGVVVLVIAAAVLFDGVGFLWGGVVFPLGFLALLGLAVWWAASGEAPAGSPRDVARKLGLGLAILAGCAVLACVGAWAGATGGGVVVAAAVIASGVALLAAAFVGGARWLILPALALALPLAVVSAAGVDTDGGVGEREYRPRQAADVRDRYELGLGSLVVDLRDAELPPGDRRLDLKVGVGEAVLVVPQDVCVASTARVGMGAVEFFDDHNGGVDVDWEDRPPARAGGTRLLVDADVGIGAFEVRHTRSERFGDRRFGRFDEPDRGPGNVGCAA